jgi:hypothetical protein
MRKMKQTTDEDQVVLGEMPDPITRELLALQSGTSMVYRRIEADGLHTYRITKEDITPHVCIKGCR